MKNNLFIVSVIFGFSLFLNGGCTSKIWIVESKCNETSQSELENLLGTKRIKYESFPSGDCLKDRIADVNGYLLYYNPNSLNTSKSLYSATKEYIVLTELPDRKSDLKSKFKPKGYKEIFVVFPCECDSFLQKRELLLYNTSNTVYRNDNSKRSGRNFGDIRTFQTVNPEPNHGYYSFSVDKIDDFCLDIEFKVIDQHNHKLSLITTCWQDSTKILFRFNPDDLEDVASFKTEEKDNEGKLIGWTTIVYLYAAVKYENIEIMKSPLYKCVFFRPCE